jgi:outer membrane autotransporter protein
MYDNGLFVDVIGRLAKADTDLTIDGQVKGSMDNLAVSLSGEAGWRFNMTERHYVEPQVEVTYTRVDNGSLQLDNGTTYEFDSVDSVIGRAGFAAGFTCPNKMGDVYVRASVVREFMGDATVRGGKFVHELDGGDTWYEYGIGANFNLNKNTYVYADVERTSGGALDEDWRANIGVRYSF